MTYADVTSAEVPALRAEVAKLRKENAALKEIVKRAVEKAKKEARIPPPHPGQMSMFGEGGGAQ